MARRSGVAAESSPIRPVRVSAARPARPDDNRAPVTFTSLAGAGTESEAVGTEPRRRIVTDSASHLLGSESDRPSLRRSCDSDGGGTGYPGRLGAELQ